jgi:iron complex transport system substrate-binding protein
MQDIFTTLTTLGEVLRDPARADRAAAELHQQLDAIRKRHAGRAAVRTLIVLDTDAQAVVGRDNFLNDLLEIAGGENVVPATMGPWPTIDHEMLLKLRPDLVLQLLPEASEQVLAEAKRVWTQFPQLPAVRSGRVQILNQWYLLQPGWHIGRTAGLFADAIDRAH